MTPEQKRDFFAEENRKKEEKEEKEREEMEKKKREDDEVLNAKLIARREQSFKEIEKVCACC